MSRSAITTSLYVCFSKNARIHGEICLSAPVMACKNCDSLKLHRSPPASRETGKAGLPAFCVYHTIMQGYIVSNETATATEFCTLFISSPSGVPGHAAVFIFRRRSVFPGINLRRRAPVIRPEQPEVSLVSAPTKLPGCRLPPVFQTGMARYAPGVEKSRPDGVHRAAQGAAHAHGAVEKKCGYPACMRMLRAGHIFAQSPQPVQRSRLTWIIGPLIHAPNHCSRKRYIRKTVSGL